VSEQRACLLCGQPVSVLRLSPAAPVYCELHAWTAQQKQAERERAGASPPPDAYREIRLEENWN
jgi:hypothetical protein